ncbi:DUF4325 domain-containing protein [Patescibacteria group bacterium]|nr:DUF4325 domain-containing protein [Patescibacteria group bacterium]
MDIRLLILDTIKKKKQIKSADIVKLTGFSRAYINRFFKELKDEGKIILIGKANKAIYVEAKNNLVVETKKKVLTVRKQLKNKNLSEDTILDQIKREGGIFIKLNKNVIEILNYAFTEMLNNAIEHSQSKNIEVEINRNKENIHFEIVDRGIGIYNNIMKKKKLKNDLEAIQDLLKGKQTTMPQAHSGEGIFFTSKIADNFVINSYKKKLIFNNKLDDIFIQDIKNFVGTKIIFTISINSKKKLENIFRQYSDKYFEFSKTKVAVKLYKMGTIYISRSQARRITTGLEKFKIIILDFKHIKTIGQGFTDEIFRVWQNHHPNIKIETQNTNKNIDFMVQRALKKINEKNL